MDEDEDSCKLCARQTQLNARGARWPPAGCAPKATSPASSPRRYEGELLLFCEGGLGGLRCAREDDARRGVSLLGFGADGRGERFGGAARRGAQLCVSSALMAAIGIYTFPHTSPEVGKSPLSLHAAVPRCETAGPVFSLPERCAAQPCQRLDAGGFTLRPPTSSPHTQYLDSRRLGLHRPGPYGPGWSNPNLLVLHEWWGGLLRNVRH